MAVYGFPHSLPGLPLSEGKPGLDLQLCAYNEDKGDRREDLPAQFEGLVETGQKGKLFCLPNSRQWQMGFTL